MRKAAHGMPSVGRHREPKWALEDYWVGRGAEGAVLEVGAGIRRDNWRALAAAEVEFVPSNDFLFYDRAPGGADPDLGEGRGQGTGRTI